MIRRKIAKEIVERDFMIRLYPVLGSVAASALTVLASVQAFGQTAPAPAQLYDSACAACHGSDGRGRGRVELGFETPPPDFTDCNFATREPDRDWYAVIHQGGPIRAFDPMMPAFGEALSDAEIQLILDHVRTFCTDERWPRGELNLPRPLYTEKAFPEDEAIITTQIAEGGDAVEVEFLWEQRLGPRSQVEISLPLISQDTGDPDGWETRFGDLALGFKRNLVNSLERGSIFTIGVELILPTGDESQGFGKGSTIIEPYFAYGQILPADFFIHIQGLGEFAAESDVEDELAIRSALGRTWTAGEGGFGRAWTPMLELLVSKGLDSGSNTNVDLAPQFQVTLNTRQHIMLNLGVRLPVNDSSLRDTQIAFYLLWEWFDGGLRDGW